MTDLKSILALARAATPGPWRLEVPDRGYCFNYVVSEGYSTKLSHDERLKLLIAESDDCVNGKNNAAYIAAMSPDVAIQLCERLERAEAASDNLGSWMAAALDDDLVCDEMKSAINDWFNARDTLQEKP
jgi:hypothetical protein